LATLDQKILDYEEQYFKEREAANQLNDLALLPPFDGWVEGESRQDYWAAEVTSLPQLVRAVADNRVPLYYLEPNMELLNKIARALKETLAIPGVRAKKRIGIVQRANPS
jgi:hypothetical protein